MLLSHGCQLISNRSFCSVCSDEKNQTRRPSLHSCRTRGAVVHNSLMIWLAGRARQQQGAIITDGEAVRAKTNTESTQSLRWAELRHSSQQRQQHPQSCANVVQSPRQLMCFFFPQLQASSGGRSFCQCVFSLLAQCFFFFFPKKTYHMLLWQTIDCTDRGEESDERKARGTQAMR